MKTNAPAEENCSEPRCDARYSLRRLFVAWLIAVLLAASGNATAVTVEVRVGGGANASFVPDSVTIAPGDTVHWIWNESLGAHSVTSGGNGHFDGLFDTGAHLAPFEFSFTYQSGGTFPYFCRPHYDMGMIGEVIVVAGTSTPTPTPAAATTLANISTRLRVETGENVLIGGFIITGTQPKRVIIRAIGPSLSSLFTGALPNPILELRDSSNVLIGSNDDWRSDQQAEIIATTIPPSNDLESAIVTTLPANNSAYTAIVRGVNNGSGIGVVEAYDLNRAVDSKLANISTRGLVQTGDNVLIGGLIVLGQNPLRVIVRAIGPSLPITGALGDPTLELFDGNGAVIASNDNWRSDQQAEIIATTIPPSDDRESAIVRNIAPGNYTAIVRGVGNTTGVALVEAFGLN